MLSSQRAARIGLCLVCAFAAVAAAYGAGLKTNYHYDAKGNLVLVCSSGTDSCDGDEGNGCEVSLLTDVNRCSSCTHACSQNHASESCTNGGCVVSSCSASYANCDGNPETGCEVSLLTDRRNCGSCGHACSLPHATAACSNGTCQVAGCLRGCHISGGKEGDLVCENYYNCNGNPADGCEATLGTTSNCASCGNACGSGQVCGSQCTGMENSHCHFACVASGGGRNK